MATTNKQSRGGRKTNARRAPRRSAARRSGAPEPTREESEISGEILGAGQGGPGRVEDPDDKHEHRHREGLSGGEGLGSDDQVIDSSFSLSGRRYHDKRHETDIESGDERYGQEHGRGTAPGAGA